jgi:peptidoglycan/xylan/chitin deacetylase (PgdA/CDA1 family)
MFVLISVALNVNANIKTIAITIDDLPFVGSTHNKPHKIKRENMRFKKIIDALKKYNIPVTGFVVAGTIEKGQWDLLKEFHQSGFIIANHTYTHLNLNVNNAERYIRNIKRADEKLSPFLTGTKFFRYPYLAEGRGYKKAKVANYLEQQGYIIAPITIDSLDFKFNQSLYRIPYSIRKHEKNLTRFRDKYLRYIWRQTVRAERKSLRQGTPNESQILLLHANLINSFFLDDIIQMYKDKGYKFVSLEQALNSESLKIQSFIDRYSKMFAIKKFQ